MVAVVGEIWEEVELHSELTVERLRKCWVGEIQDVRMKKQVSAAGSGWVCMAAGHSQTWASFLKDNLQWILLLHCR